MDDAVLIVCGGAARSIMADRPTDRLRSFSYDPTGSERGDRRIWTEDALANVFEGIRVAVVFSMLGGRSADGPVPDTIRVASERGCRTVAVVALPFGFEEGRRAKAMDSLRDVLCSAERTILIDPDVFLDAGDRDGRFDEVFRMQAHRVSFALDCAIQLLDGAFFSTFSEPVYTFSYVDPMLISDAVGMALRTVKLPTTPSIGKLVVAVGSGCTNAEVNQVMAAATFRTGVLPDVYRRDDLDPNRVVVFVPVHPRLQGEGGRCRGQRASSFCL